MEKRLSRIESIEDAIATISGYDTDTVETLRGYLQFGKSREGEIHCSNLSDPESITAQIKFGKKGKERYLLEVVLVEPSFVRASLSIIGAEDSCHAQALSFVRNEFKMVVMTNGSNFECALEVLLRHLKFIGNFFYKLDKFVLRRTRENLGQKPRIGNHEIFALIPNGFKVYPETNCTFLEEKSLGCFAGIWRS